MDDNDDAPTGWAVLWLVAGLLLAFWIVVIVVWIVP